MNVKLTTRHLKPKDAARTQSDWSRFDSLTDAQIEAATRRDPDAAPLLTPAWLKKAKLVRAPGKDMVSIRIDKDVLEHFRSEERWQTRINGLLRMVMEYEKAETSSSRRTTSIFDRPFSSTIEETGFLSSEINEAIARHREANRTWFELADELNRVAQRQLSLWSVPADDSRAFIAALLFMRGLSNFQGAILLAERGMTLEAGILVRSCFETVFCLGATHKNKDFAEVLIRDDADRRSKLARVLLKLPDDSSGLDPADRKKLRRFLDDLVKSGRETTALTTIAAAKLAGLTEIYDTYYRGLSNDAAHPSVVALNRHVDTNEKGEVIGFRWGPSANDVKDTLMAACTASIYLVNWAKDIFGSEQTANDLGRCWATYKKLALEESART